MCNIHSSHYVVGFRKTKLYIQHEQILQELKNIKDQYQNIVYLQFEWASLS